MSTHTVDTSNLLMTFSLLICAYIHPCPGPMKRTPKYPCTSCQKGVTARSKAVSCDICEDWTHIKCGGISEDMYNATIQHSEPINFICNPCAIASVPGVDMFDDNPVVTNCSQSEDLNYSDLPDVNSSELDDRSTDVYKCFKKRGLHFIHLNVRSLLPKLDELHIIAIKSKAAVIGVTETWLDDSVEDSEIELQDMLCSEKTEIVLVVESASTFAAT